MTILLALAAPFLLWGLLHFLHRIEQAVDRPLPAERGLRVWSGPHDWSARGEL